MARLRINRFGGSRPRLDAHLLGESQAGYALDARFEHGSLDAWREPRQIRAAPQGTITSLQHQCCWLDFDTCVDYALSSPQCPDQVFITGRRINTPEGDTTYPERVVIDPDGCEVSFHRLGLPCPMLALDQDELGQPTEANFMITEVNTEEKDFMGYSLAYQYENAFGERSQLSPATKAIMLKDGATVIITAWPVPDPSWGVTTVRFFRTVSAIGASMSMPDGNNEPDTTWMLIGEADIDAPLFTYVTGYTDTLESALEEDIVLPPPQGLRGITWVQSQNTLAGYVGNRVYFTENHEVHNWRHYLDLDDNICAMKEVNNALYVMTDGRPYVLEGAKECRNAHLRAVVRLPVDWPMVACGNKHIGEIPEGVVYPSHNGLVLLSGSSKQSLFTHPLYAPEDWQALQPHTVIPEMYGGKLFVFARGGSFVVNTASGTEPGWDLDTHSELSDRNVIDAFRTRSGELYILKDDSAIYHWNKGTKLRPYEWRSPLFRLDAPVNFGGFRYVLKNGEVRAEIRYDGDTAFNEKLFMTDEQTLPLWAFGHDWEIRLNGTATVSLVAIATSMRDFG